MLSASARANTSAGMDTELVSHLTCTLPSSDQYVSTFCRPSSVRTFTRNSENVRLNCAFTTASIRSGVDNLSSFQDQKLVQSRNRDINPFGRPTLLGRVVPAWLLASGNRCIYARFKCR